MLPKFFFQFLLVGRKLVCLFVCLVRSLEGLIKTILAIFARVNIDLGIIITRVNNDFGIITRVNIDFGIFARVNIDFGIITRVNIDFGIIRLFRFTISNWLLGTRFS